MVSCSRYVFFTVRTARRTRWSMRWRCTAWVEHRRVPVEAIGGGDLPHPALVEAMVQGGVGSHHLLLQSSDASDCGGGA